MTPRRTRHAAQRPGFTSDDVDEVALVQSLQVVAANDLACRFERAHLKVERDMESVCYSSPCIIAHRRVIVHRMTDGERKTPRRSRRQVSPAVRRPGAKSRRHSKRQDANVVLKTDRSQFAGSVDARIPKTDVGACSADAPLSSSERIEPRGGGRRRSSTPGGKRRDQTGDACRRLSRSRSPERRSSTAGTRHRDHRAPTHHPPAPVAHTQSG